MAVSGDGKMFFEAGAAVGVFSGKFIDAGAGGKAGVAVGAGGGVNEVALADPRGWNGVRVGTGVEVVICVAVSVLVAVAVAGW